ncbi:TadE/TadG family type IV pilus assembly protein [Sphingomonas sp. CROZ-RG-20F-R02-07]|uniref:TadE/TadG family type IV pilus assembly protein n=1 Tax=Sphingomonas sp. CROZ-RG-20F-R02-07 TaxID=2914832 RepID=UPI001F55FE37|nr:TadE/TadG family type IV pilus assembly protein [Sphingomonas sp. CROZ-RG-20F-R02-07]
MASAAQRSGKPRRGWRSIVPARDGATIIEFALVVTPFFAVLMAILQTSLIYFSQEALETSVEAAARSVVTGKAQAADATGSSSGMSPAQLQTRFRNAACATLPGYMSCAKLLVDVRSATSWNAMDTSMPTITFDANGNPNNTLSYSLGSQGAVVLVRLMYLWPIQAAPMQLGLVNVGNGQRLIVATSVAKTESYS